MFQKSTYFHDILIFLLALISRVAYMGVIGVRLGGDSAFYRSTAALLTETNFSLSSLIDHNIPFFYWAYPFVIAVFQQNNVLIVIFQIIIQSLTAVLLYRIGAVLFGLRIGVFAGVIYALFWELIQWDMYILTDSLFTAMVVLLLYALIRAQQTGDSKRWLIFAFVLFALILLRPTALPVAVSVIWFITSGWGLRYRLAMALLALGIFILWVGEFWIFDTTSRYGADAYVKYFQSLFVDGIVIRDRPEYTLHVQWDPGFTSHNAITFIWVFVNRLIGFWYIWTAAFSKSHILYNILTMVPLYVFGLLGLVTSYRKGVHKKIITFMIMVIGTYWVFQGITEVDYDWRYRLPVLPFVILFAAYGISIFLGECKRLYGNS